MAYDLLTSISQDADERARFRARRKFQMDLEHNRLASFEEGKLEVARNLLSNGVSEDIIVRSTGLSPDKIRSLIS